MRSLKINGEELDGANANNLMGEISLVPAFHELWNLWEIQCLILVSLCLQVFLFLFAGSQRRSTSPVLHTALWLAYLSADSVAIFVLGHLAVHASPPGHQLMSFWAPFVLVHLGGQDTITALSRQDNVLWKRHLLSLVTQVGVAGYVVAEASWPDGRLKAAMVLMFISGCFKYAERTLCLYLASPEKLRSSSLGGLSLNLKKLQDPKGEADPFWGSNESGANKMRETLRNILEGDSSSRLLLVDASIELRDILTADCPLNSASVISFAEDHLPGILEWLRSCSRRCNVYENVGAVLVDFYHGLYTKSPVRNPFIISVSYSCAAFSACAVCCILYNIFQYASTPIALLLFWAAKKGDQNQLHSSRSVIVVSYTLLVGAIVLDLSYATISIFSKYIQLPATCKPWSKKQWSEELAQYSMIKRHIVQDTVGMASIRQWTGRCLGSWGVDLLESTHTPVTADYTAIKEFILDKLLVFGTRKKWNIASTCGQLAVQDWMDKNRGSYSERLRNTIVKTIGASVDFPTSVLIWHVATEICYYAGDNSSTDSDEMKKHKQMSRELSNYIMYLVFKSCVMLTTNSQYVHDKAHGEIGTILSGKGQQITDLDEKAAVMKIFQTKNKEEQQDQSSLDTDKHEESADKDNAADSHHLQKLSQSAQVLYSPVVPRACEVAQELISINDHAKRWDLIASVWSEMLFFTAPRCGAAFHYEHLSTGGEFITHVLILMKFLGPFLPPPGA